MSVLEKFGLDIETLDSLSYKTSLHTSMKRTLRHFDKKEVMEDVQDAIEWYNEKDYLYTFPVDVRVKSIQSASLKFDRYPDSVFSRVFNDILGFRAICPEYSEILLLDKEDKLRVVDMSNGKADDDGYRGIHIYYQKDNFHYPIEIQFNTFYDRQFNNWMHDLVYKRGYPDKIGVSLRETYESGRIKTRRDFEEVLSDVLSSCEKV